MSQATSHVEDQAEMAQLIIDIYGRRTSVLFDLSAITDLVN